MKRQRGRGRRSGGGGNNPNRHFESNGPDVKIRGSAQQILDKYLQYARDAQTSGDRVMSEAYFQHAEHYQRLLASMQPKDKPKRDREDRDEGDEAERTEAETTDTSASEGEAADKPDERDGEKPRRRRERAPREKAEADPLEVVDAESSDEQPAAAEADSAGGAEDAPKPRKRRTYKKRDAEAPAVESDEADGVMATLSRGRPKADTPESSDTSEDVDTPAK